MKVSGRDGTTLADTWRQRPGAYLSISIPDFPNFFMLNGPNGPVGNFSLIEVAELQFGYVLQLIDQLHDGTAREISARREATDTLEAERTKAAEKTVWVTGCKSWYLDDRGIPAVWPWSFERFRNDARTGNWSTPSGADRPRFSAVQILASLPTEAAATRRQGRQGAEFAGATTKPFTGAVVMMWQSADRRPTADHRERTDCATARPHESSRTTLPRDQDRFTRGRRLAAPAARSNPSTPGRPPGPVAHAGENGSAASR
jgi:hypothetical protein